MAKQRSVMKHNFSEVPDATIPRSSFDRSHGHKTTFDAGFLVPIFTDEALPGDTFNLKTHGFARMATPIHPVMDNMYMETFYFAVPMRLVWDNFVKMMGEQDNPDDSTDYLVPTITQTNYVQSLFDYFGLPLTEAQPTMSALYHRAYRLIWNEWFRDQNLQNSIAVDKDDGPDDARNIDLRRRGKRHDYFTSALPWPQKGPDVTLPLGTTAPVMTNLQNPLLTSLGNFVDAPLQGDTDTINLEYGDNPIGGGTKAEILWGNETGMQVDLQNATAATINQMRTAFQIQKMYERDARGGTRYTEIMRAHFGVTSPDSRLQRPEFLGGGRSTVNINPVAATNRRPDEGAGDPQSLGELGGYGTVSLSGHGFTKSFTEHCIIIGLVNVRADITYQQGIERQYSRRDRLDFFWPALAHLGEQEILNKEIYFQGTPEDEQVFGYQERFAEYRYKPSKITGKFRSDYSESLDSWHLSQHFDDLPVLSNEFIRDEPPVDRVIAVPDEPHFIADFYHQLKCARPMPLYGVPGNIDRF